MASPTAYVTAIRRSDSQIYCSPAGAEASEAEAAISGSKSLSRINPLVEVQAELKTRTVKGEERGSGKGSQGSIRRVGEEEGGETGGGDVSGKRRAGNVGGKSEGGGRKSYRTKGCKEEEEEAVAVIAGVLRKKFGPQIVKEELEEWGSGMGSSKDEGGVGRREEEEEEEEGDDEEEEEEAEAEASEEDAPPTTSPPTPPPPAPGSYLPPPSSPSTASSPPTSASPILPLSLPSSLPTPNCSAPIPPMTSCHVSASSKTLLAKLQFFVELVGEKAAGRVARSYPAVLQLSKENLQGKVAELADLIGQENAVRAVAQFPLLLTSSETVVKKSFKELVREVEEAFEGSGEAGNGMQRAKGNMVVVDCCLRNTWGNDESGERAVAVTEQQLVELEATKKLVCLQQFLQFTDKQFEEKFGVKL
ncbi:unnamed protein product [Closterium sp. Naga37s-1]|nr:unnamed protein product [Closterium sp. Naga37s-1]